MSEGDYDPDRLRDGFVKLMDQNAEVINWVDRVLQVLDDSPEIVEFLNERSRLLAWSIDHLREARFAMKEATS